MRLGRRGKACPGLFGGMKIEVEVSMMGAVQDGAKTKSLNNLNLGSHRQNHRAGCRN